jgi:hypothetical protein
MFFFEISLGLRVAGTLLIEGYLEWWTDCYCCKMAIGEVEVDLPWRAGSLEVFLGP